MNIKPNRSHARFVDTVRARRQPGDWIGLIHNCLSWVNLVPE